MAAHQAPPSLGFSIFKVPPFTLLPTFLALFFYYNTSLSVFKYVMFSMFLFIKIAFIFKREFKEDLNKWKDTLCSRVGFLSIVKMSILSKFIYIHYTLNQNLKRRAFFEKLIWKCKASKIAKATLKLKKEQNWRAKLPDFKTYYKT